MGDDDKEIGILFGRLEGIVGRLESIEDGGMALCQLHSQSLIRIETKLDGLKQKPDPSQATPRSREPANGISFGKLKAWGAPAIILSVLIALAGFQYYREGKAAAVVKDAAVTEAAAVAVKSAKAAHNQLDRDEVRRVLLEMIRETQLKGTP